jgi:tetratricopeptide (TPR) repeat protein
MIANVIAALRSLNYEPTAEEIADIFWLAFQMDRDHAPTPEPVTREQPALVHEARAQPQLTPVPARSDTDGTWADQVAEGGNLYPHASPSTATAVGGAGSLPFRSPAAVALPGARGIARALRPLMRRVPSRSSTTLDERATANHIAHEGIRLPVLRPTPTRWLDAALIIDTSASMAIWQQTIFEFRRLLERQGAFRDVRVWELETDAADGSVHLYAESGATLGRRRKRNPRELIDPSGQRLMILVSDCVANAWHDGAVTRILAVWARMHPIMIVQVLPQHLWSRTALSGLPLARLRSTAPGTPNTYLHDDLATRKMDTKRSMDVLSPLEMDQEPSSKGPLIKVRMPIVTLEPRALAVWAQMVAGTSGDWTPGFILEGGIAHSSAEYGTAVLEGSGLDTQAADQLVRRFRATASPTARRLASLCAATPLTLPIMRLVQRTMLPDSRQVHLAEVFLSGLLKEQPSTDPQIDISSRQYDFVAGVRELLLDALSGAESLRVLEAVSEFIELRLGQAFDFRALLADPTALDGLAIAEESQPFARIAVTVLRRLGGRYAALANKIAGRVETPHGQDADSNGILSAANTASRDDLTQHLAAAAACLARDDLVGAEEALLEALRIASDNPSIRTRLADVYFRQGNLGKALAQFDVLATYYEKRQSLDRAIDVLTFAAKLSPSHIPINNRLAHMLLRRGYAERGLQELMRVAKLQQDAGLLKDAVSNLQEAAYDYNLLGQRAQAQTIYDTITRIAPNDIDARVWLSIMYVIEGRTEEAIAQKKQIVRIFVQTRDFDNAIAEMHQIYALDQSDTDNLYQLGDVLMRREEYEQAAHVYGRLAKIPNVQIERVEMLQAAAKRMYDQQQAALSGETISATRKESIALLRAFRPDLSDADSHLDAIATELGDTSLALYLAGSLLAQYRTEMAPEAYIRKLQDPALLEHRGQTQLHTAESRQIVRALEISLSWLDPTTLVDAWALDLLAHMSHGAPGEPMPRTLLLEAKGLSDDSSEETAWFDAALKRLVDLGLLARHDNGMLGLDPKLAPYVG